MTTATLSIDPTATQQMEYNDLLKIATPEATKTWTPIPHHVIVDEIEEAILKNKWTIASGKDFELAVSSEGAKLFGVVQISIPTVQADSEFGLAIGFRNSHDKSTSLRVALGTRVFVCDNMMISGDVQVRRVHTRYINPRETIDTAFMQIPQLATKLTDWFSSLRTFSILADTGVSLLAKCAEVGALPISDFLQARTDYLDAYRNESETIQHGQSLWAVYQAVSAQWKHRSVTQIPERTAKLHQIMNTYRGVAEVQRDLL